MLSVRKISVTSLMVLAVSGISIILVSCHVNTGANKSGQVFKLDAILSGEDIRYEGSYGGTLEELKADSKGGKVKYNEDVYEVGLCSAVFRWKFDKDINNVKADEEIGVTLSYSISDEKCVEKMAGNWTVLSLNYSYYEHIPMDKLNEKVKEKYPENAVFVQGHQGIRLELGKYSGEVSFNDKIKFPEPAEPGSYYMLRFSVFRYYMSNNPLAVYVFEAS